MVDLLNDNAGVLTLAFVVLTFLTLLETRAARVASTASAHVAARPEPYIFVRQTYLKLRLRNYGPAVAKDVRLTLAWRNGSGTAGRNKTIVEPLMGVGDEAQFHPALLLELEGRVGHRKLADLGDEGLMLRVEVSWLDERRHLFAPWLRVRTRQRYNIDAREYSDSVHGGPLVLQKDAIREQLEEINDQLRAMNDRAIRREMASRPIGDPRARAHIEHSMVMHWLRSQRMLWVARWNAWTRRS